MLLPSYFIDFLSEIRLTTNQANDLKKAHITLRNRLEKYDDLSDIIVSTFLQGSYIRSTALRPKSGDKSDVDIVVVTNIDMEEYAPTKALKLFKPFLDDYYEDKYRIQKRSLGISLSNVDLDVAITVAPSESKKSTTEKDDVMSDLNIEDIFMEQGDSTYKSIFLESIAMKADSPEWKKEPLYIADREFDNWTETNPLEQIRWTYNKNKKTNGNYVNVVKALKWWRKEKYPEFDHPKSYPLEHFIGNCCPDNINYVSEGITLTLEKIVSDHEEKPVLYDRGVLYHDVFGRLTEEEYNEFYSQVCDAADIAREALDSKEIKESALKWKELFGNKFPSPPQENSEGFKRRTEKTKKVPRGRFA